MFTSCLAATAMLTNSVHAQGVADVMRSYANSPAYAAIGDAPVTASGESVVESDAIIFGRRTRAWNGEQGSRYLLLDGDVSIKVGGFAFSAEQAVVRIDRLNVNNQRAYRLLVYLDEARGKRGGGTTTTEGDRMLVTVATFGEVQLRTDLLDRQDSSDNALVLEGNARFGQYLNQAAQPFLNVPDDASLPAPDRGQRPAPAPNVTITPDGVVTQPARPTQPGDGSAAPAVSSQTDRSAQRRTPPTTTPMTSNTVLPAEGVVTFSADRVRIEPGENETLVSLLGGVTVVYQNFGPNQQPGQSTMTLTAHNAVLFVDGDLADAAGSNLDASSVRGIYLEDNVVATNGEMTVRAPRVFYDLELNQAVVLDAVLFAWDVERDIPLYLRADKLRQHAANRWSAQGATLTTSAFAVPHLAIGAEQITIEQTGVAPDGSPRLRYEADSPAFEVGGTPVAGWPRMAGNVTDPGLRRISFSGDLNGANLETRWDVFALAGQQTPEGLDWTIDLDWVGDHGPGVGTDFDYQQDNYFGSFEGYLLPNDHGEDSIADRNDIEHDGDVRGYALWRHHHTLSDVWTLQLEGAYLSDPTFLEEFFDQATIDETWESSVYVKRQERDWAFTLLANYRTFEPVAQLTDFRARGATVDRLPEAGYYRVGTSWADGRLLYFTENRLTRMQYRPDENSLADRGFPPSPINNTPIDELLGAAGIPLDWILRADTRHELQAPLTAGAFRLTPFVAGRFTAYDSEDVDLSGRDEKERASVTTGLRIETELSRVYNGVNSNLFDLHRMRHIMAPHGQIFWTGSTTNPEDFLVYDPDVEATTEGFGAELGLRQTFQTKRGRADAYRSVDWLTLDTTYVYRSEDTNIFYPLPRHYTYRPTYSQGGQHLYSEAKWLVSDTLAAYGEITHDFNEGETAQWRVGVELDHTPRLRSFMDYTELDFFPARLLSYGFAYKLTDTWTGKLEHILSFAGNNTSRQVNVTLIREIPQAYFGILLSHDEIDDEFFAGFVFKPKGSGDAVIEELGLD